MRNLVFAFLFILPLLGVSQVRRAQSLIEKDRKLEAYDLLNKSVNKDSLASAEHFLLANLFIDLDYEFYDIDSAYHHIIIARSDFGNLESKEQGKLIGSGFTLQNYDSLQRHIESAGFDRAMNLDREEDYINFMGHFTESLLLDSAKLFRNRDAYRKASNENSYKAYQSFFLTYPNAKEAKEAEERYHLLLYQDQTSSGKLSDFESFLNAYPSTWHRREAETEIFKIRTGKNTIDSYRKFIEDYPESFLGQQAKLFMYSLSDDKSKEMLLNSGFIGESLKDSIVSLNNLQSELLILTHNGTHYEVINSKGDPIIDSLDRVADQAKCQEINDLVIELSPSVNKTINVNSDIIAEGQFASFSKPARGFINLSSPEGDLIIHENGMPTTGKFHEEATMPGGFIAYKTDNKWGVESITGISMIDPQLDTIFEFNEHIILAKDSHMGIHKIAEFYPLLDGESFEFNLQYDKVSIVRGNELYVELGNQTGLLDRNLRPIIPLGDPEIEILDEGYFLETNDSILDSRVAKVWYSDIKSNDSWTIGIRQGNHDVYYDGVKQFEVEKAELIGNSAVRLTIDNKIFCYFKPKSRMELSEGDVIKPLRKMGENSLVRHYLYTDQKKRQSLIDQNGKHIKIPRFDRLIDLGEDYMIFSVKGLVYNVLDNKGNVVLENVDAATGLNNGYISYLSKGKFGLLNSRNNTHIKPKYDKPLKRYNDELFVIEERGALGLINRQDSLFVSPRYEEILALNDSIAVLKANFRYSFWDLKNGKILLDNLSDYWAYKTPKTEYFKVFKGIGYGVWSSEKGIILGSTFSELEIKSKGNIVVFITEKWVEEADLVIMIYYDKDGALIRKSVLSTHQYEELQCPSEY